MKGLFYLGWVLLAVAFLAGAAEVPVRPITGQSHVFVTAQELWYTLWPGGMLAAQIRIENTIPGLWDPVIVTLLSLPAWAILGVPGCVLIGVFRPERPGDKQKLEDVRQHEETFMHYHAALTEAKNPEDPEAEHETLEPWEAGHDAADYAIRQKHDLALVDDMDEVDEDDYEALIRQAGVEPRMRVVPTPEESDFSAEEAEAKRLDADGKA